MAVEILGAGFPFSRLFVSNDVAGNAARPKSGRLTPNAVQSRNDEDFTVEAQDIEGCVTASARKPKFAVGRGAKAVEGALT